MTLANELDEFAGRLMTFERLLRERIAEVQRDGSPDDPLTMAALSELHLVWTMWSGVLPGGSVVRDGA